MARHFQELLQARWDQHLFLCVGIDPVKEKIPGTVTGNSIKEKLVRFCCAIVEATAPYAAAFKPNAAFFERYGENGWLALRRIVACIHEIAPEVPVILDAKRGDIGNTNLGYVEAIFDDLGLDAVTLHPYLGREAMVPFTSRENKGCIFMGKTSNPGAGEFQDLKVNGEDPLWLHVAKNIASGWNQHGNCGLVFGATYPEETAQAREAVGDDLFFLAPGLGAQGGDLKAAVEAARNSRGQGVVFSSSRDIIFASNDADFAEVAGRKAAETSAQLAAAMSV